MRLRMLLGVLVLSLAVSSCGLIKEKGGDEEKSDEKVAEEKKAAEETKAADEAQKKTTAEAAKIAVEANAKAKEAQQAAEDIAKKASEERAELEAEKAKLVEEKKAAEEAAAKAEGEKLEAEKNMVTESVAGLSEAQTKTKLELRANLEAWESEGAADKVQALTAFLAEYEKVEAELGGVKAYLMQDDLEKAKTGLETLKGTWDAMEKQAAVLLEDKPQPMDGATRAKLLELIATESCLQKQVAAGTLTDADLPGKRAELLTAAGMSAEQYGKLQEKLKKQPEQTDLTVLEAHMGKLCPETIPTPAEEGAETGEVYWTKACDHAMGLMKAQMGGDLPQEEMDKIMLDASKQCLEALKKVDPAAADMAAACVLKTTSVDDLDACDPEKLAAKDEEAKPEEAKPEEVKPEEVKPEEVKPEEVKPEEKPKAPAISTNMKFSGSIKGKKGRTMSIHKNGSKLTGTLFYKGGKVPLKGSFSKKGASFAGKKGNDGVKCNGTFSGTRLQGRCTGTLGGNFTLKGKSK